MACRRRTWETLESTFRVQINNMSSEDSRMEISTSAFSACNGRTIDVSVIPLDSFRGSIPRSEPVYRVSEYLSLQAQLTMPNRGFVGVRRGEIEWTREGKRQHVSGRADSDWQSADLPSTSNRNPDPRRSLKPVSHPNSSNSRTTTITSGDCNITSQLVRCPQKRDQV